MDGVQVFEDFRSWGLRSLLDVANGKCGFTNQEPVLAGKHDGWWFYHQPGCKQPIKMAGRLMKLDGGF